MGEPREPPALDGLLTEADIDRLAADGLVELETDEETASPLLRVTRRISAQYMRRFAKWAEQAPADPEDARRAVAEVERLASTSGDEAMREVLAALSTAEDAQPGFWGGWRSWVQRFASLFVDP